jgi:hypothetical protein
MAAALLLGLACAAAWIWFNRPGPPPGNSRDQAVIAEIERLGGTAAVDDSDPEQPVVSVNLTATDVGDAQLDVLKGLTRLRRLYLSGTRVTDRGLSRLEGLEHLEDLYLIGDAITDDGLEHIARLKGLRRLDLSGTRVTDRGLEHLQGLKELRTLDLAQTRVTRQGIQALQAALPGTDIRLRTF